MQKFRRNFPKTLSFFSFKARSFLAGEASPSLPSTAAAVKIPEAVEGALPPLRGNPPQRPRYQNGLPQRRCHLFSAAEIILVPLIQRTHRINKDEEHNCRHGRIHIANRPDDGNQRQMD